jgi:hypothetical protein
MVAVAKSGFVSAGRVSLSAVLPAHDGPYIVCSMRGAK